MNELTVEDLLETIVQEDARYTIDAYHFVREGLDYTVKKLQKPRHVNGGELLDGIREYALEEFGPVSKRVLSEWGIIVVRILVTLYLIWFTRGYWERRKKIHWRILNLDMISMTLSCDLFSL